MTYQTELLTLPIASYSIDIERITNIDELLEALLDKGVEHEDVKEERIPYWAELWPSALALSHHLTTMNLDWSSKTVVEIGCGLGLPGIVAGHLGAASVTMTDYLAEAIEFAETNWNRNNKSNVVFKTLDWRTPDASFAADVVIAADVAYEERSFEFLAPAFRTLCKPNGVILLSEPNRIFAKKFLQ
jgi:predicted nicotinamide N-methyase